MGLPINKLYATNTNDESGRIHLSAWIPEKHEDGKYYCPKNTPIGLDHWVPNTLDLKPEEGTVEVRIIKSDKETGIWLVCFDDYFGDEQHLYAGIKPMFKEGTKNIDWKLFNKLIDDDDSANPFTLHVGTGIKMVAGDGPIAVTLERI